MMRITVLCPYIEIIALAIRPKSAHSLYHDMSDRFVYQCFGEEKLHTSGVTRGIQSYNETSWDWSTMMPERHCSFVYGATLTHCHHHHRRRHQLINI